MTNPRLLGHLSGYATEGGIDGRFQPTTVYSPLIHLHKTHGPELAENLWEEYEAVIDVAGEVGLDGIRLDVAWARLEPRHGDYRHEALQRYDDLVRYAQAKGMWVTVCLVDTAWPAWLGAEAWLFPWVETELYDYVRWATTGLSADGFILFANARQLVNGYVSAACAPWREGALADADTVARNLQRYRETIEGQPLAHGRWVRDWQNVFVGAMEKGLDDALAGAHPEEFCLRPLVGGYGPLGTTSALVVRGADGWIIGNRSVAEELRLRRVGSPPTAPEV